MITTIRSRTAGLLAAPTLFLTACSIGPAPAPAPTVAASQEASRAPATRPLQGAGTPPLGTVIDAESGGGVIGSDAVPTWDASAEQGALTAAVTAMTAYARPDLTFDTWFSGIQAVMTQQAAEAYAYVDPANIHAHRLTGAAALAQHSPTAYLAWVDVPTDVGTYTVLLARQDATSPWLALTFTPPAGIH
jgi:hypothetical protein